MDNLVASVGFDSEVPHPCASHCDTCETAAPTHCIVCGVNRHIPPFCPCVDGMYENEMNECVVCAD